MGRVAFACVIGHVQWMGRWKCMKIGELIRLGESAYLAVAFQGREGLHELCRTQALALPQSAVATR